MIIAVDFDGTCVHSRYPDIGDPIPGAIEALRAIAALGHKIILNTCRENSPVTRGGMARQKRQYLAEAEAWFLAHGIKLRSVNENHPDDDFREYPMLRRKIHADIYIDDRNFGGMPSWDSILQYVREQS